MKSFKIPPPSPPPLPPTSSLPDYQLMEAGRSRRLYNLESSRPTRETKRTTQEEESKMCRRLFDNEKFHFKQCRLLSCNLMSVTSVLQEGPSCGLAALCMAAQMLGVNLTLPTILELARSRGFTNKGEMFSAVNMSLLAQEVLSIDVELLTDGLDKQQTKVVAHLAAGQPILVPYDADMNHEPTCRQGHKAHWAVLTGVVFIVPQSFDFPPSSAFQQDTLFPALFHSRGILDDHCYGQLAKLSVHDDVKIYVYAHQGKSCHMNLWSYEMLAKSNANLTELSPLRRRSIDGYVLPSNGVEGGLCGQVLLLRQKVSLT